jgi:hypothetical protein
MYPTTDGSVVSLPQEALTWSAELDAAKAAKKAAEEAEREAKNKLKAAIGLGLFGTLPNGETYKLAEIHKASYTVQEQHYRQLTKMKNKGKAAA